MKNLNMSVPLAVACATLMAASAEAATLAYSPGDLFLGFRSSSSTTDFLINIGQASLYRDAAPGTSFTLAIGSIKTDLDAVFSTNWNSVTRPDLFWGVAGSPAGSATTDPTQTLYATSPQTSFGTPALAPALPGSMSAQSQVTGRMTTLATVYTGAGDSANGVTPASNPKGLRQDGTVGGTWRAFMGGGQAFTGNSYSYFTSGIEGNFTNGEEGTAVDLWRVTPGITTGVASYEGTFTINSSGIVTYSVVPEPTSAAMLGLGAGLLGLARRRRQTVAA